MRPAFIAKADWLVAERRDAIEVAYVNSGAGEGMAPTPAFLFRLAGTQWVGPGEINLFLVNDDGEGWERMRVTMTADDRARLVKPTPTIYPRRRRWWSRVQKFYMREIH